MFLQQRKIIHQAVVSDGFISDCKFKQQRVNYYVFGLFFYMTPCLRQCGTPNQETSLPDFLSLNFTREFLPLNFLLHLLIHTIQLAEFWCNGEILLLDCNHVVTFQTRTGLVVKLFISQRKWVSKICISIFFLGEVIFCGRNRVIIFVKVQIGN